MTSRSGDREIGDDLQLDEVRSGQDLAEMLRALRRRHARTNRDSPLTYRELASKSGLAHTVIGDYFTGRSLPPTDRLDIVVQLLGASPAEQRTFAEARDRIEESRRTATHGERPGYASIIPRQLPAPPRYFAGRTDQINAMTAQLDAAATRSVMVLTAIDGTGGIGKTTLALHWAHQVADRFPDGQLYVDLRGFDPSNEPLAPDQAIRGFLDALGVSSERIPPSAAARLGLYRSLLARRRMLIVLDNAHDDEQVRDLLPADATCVAVVTSRRELDGLAVTHGITQIALELFTRPEARALLIQRLANERLDAHTAAVDELIDLCARLPLALAIVAARAALRPDATIPEVVAELREHRVHLDAFTARDPATDLRTVLSWSYRELDAPAARVFRQLALHPGPQMTRAAAASLAALPQDQADDILARLVRARLLDQPSADRFSMHDLLRSYGREQVERDQPDTDPLSAISRMAEHYLHTAHRAAQLLSPKRRSPVLAEPAPGVTVESLADLDAAWNWFETGRTVLPALLTTAAHNNTGAHAWLIPRLLTSFFERRGYHSDFITCQQIALTAARDADNREGQAHAHRGLGRACGAVGSLTDAHTNLERAVALFQGTDPMAEARSHLDLASWVYERQGQYDKALAETRHALTLFEQLGDQAGEAQALNNIGWCHILLGNFGTALEYCANALAAQQRLGARPAEAATWDSLGFAHHHLGHNTQAADCYARALEIYRDLDNRAEQAETLTRLGESHRAACRNSAARAAWQQAAAILDQINPIDSTLLREQIKLLPKQDGPSRTGSQS